MSLVITSQPLLSYFYGLLYFLSFLFLFLLDSPLYVWVCIEVIIIFLVSLALIFTSYKSFLPSFMQYFVLQTFASFVLLFCIASPLVSSFIMFYLTAAIFYVAFIVKLALFPFFWWYISILKDLPFWLLFLIIVPQKLPLPLLFFFILSELPSIPSFVTYFITFLSCRILLSSIISFSSNDLRSALIFSSLGSSCWICLGILSGLSVFILYYSAYIIIIVLLVISLTNSSSSFHSSIFSISKPSQHNFSISLFYFLNCFCWLRLSGLPPFPVFFVKMLIVFRILSVFSLSVSRLVVFLFLLASFIYLFIYARVIFSILFK